MRGFYRMQRGWMDEGAFGDEPFCQRAAWLWLIEEAAWEERRVFANGRTIVLKRGQLTHSTRFMASIWGWSEARVRRFLERRRSDAAIDAATDAGQYVITICNFDAFSPLSQSSDAGSDAGHVSKSTQSIGNTLLPTEEGARAPAPSDPAVSPAGVIFGKEPGGCLHYLIGCGVAEDPARSLLGRWRGQYGDGAVIEAVSAAAREGSVSDPKAWVTKALKRRFGRPELTEVAPL